MSLIVQVNGTINHFLLITNIVPQQYRHCNCIPSSWDSSCLWIPLTIHFLVLYTTYILQSHSSYIVLTEMVIRKLFFRPWIPGKNDLSWMPSAFRHSDHESNKIIIVRSSYSYKQSSLASYTSNRCVASQCNRRWVTLPYGLGQIWELNSLRQADEKLNNCPPSLRLRTKFVSDDKQRVWVRGYVLQMRCLTSTP